MRRHLRRPLPAQVTPNGAPAPRAYEEQRDAPRRAEDTLHDVDERDVARNCPQKKKRVALEPVTAVRFTVQDKSAGLRQELEAGRVSIPSDGREGAAQRAETNSARPSRARAESAPHGASI